MPSWNIHIAHAEGLMRGEGPLSRALLDCNAFLFGNLIPDIYVGYMVPEVHRPIQYRVTHFAEPEHIPKPREGEFWDVFVAPLLCREAPGCHELAAVVRAARAARADRPGKTPYDPASIAEEVERMGRMNNPERYGEPTRDDFPPEPFGWGDATRAVGANGAEPVSAAPGRAWPSAPGGPGAWREAARAQTRLDMTLGAWVHLLADNIWNMRVNEFLDERGEKPNRDFRIKKQGDFDLFGKSLDIDAVPRPTPELIDAAARFGQYPVDAQAVYYTVAVAHETVRTNHLAFEPAYRLLDRAFFDRVSREVELRANELYAERGGL